MLRQRQRQRLKKSQHVCWPGRFKLQHLLRCRVFDRQPGGVQSQAVNLALVVNGWLPKRSAVFDVTADWMPKLGKMYADLIRAAGFQPTFQFSEIANPS